MLSRTPRLADTGPCFRFQQGRLLSMASVSCHLIDMIRSVLKAAARLTFSERRFERITALLLDWWVPERISSVFASWRIGTVPLYLADNIHRTADAQRHLRQHNMLCTRRI